MSALFWALWVVGFVVLEAIGLRRSDDQWQPLTYYVRKTLPKWLLAAGIAWLGFHFLIQR